MFWDSASLYAYLDMKSNIRRLHRSSRACPWTCCFLFKSESEPWSHHSETSPPESITLVSTQLLGASRLCCIASTHSRAAVPSPEPENQRWHRLLCEQARQQADTTTEMRLDVCDTERGWSLSHAVLSTGSPVFRGRHGPQAVAGLDNEDGILELDLQRAGRRAEQRGPGWAAPWNLLSRNQLTSK